MAVTMVLFWVSLVLSIIGSNASGEFSVLHSPDSLKFSGSSPIVEGLLKEVFSAALGLSVEENSKWDGLYVADPFNTPEAIVEVHIDGVDSLGSSAALKFKTFSLNRNEFEPDTFEAVSHRIKQRFPTGSRIMDIDLSPEELTQNMDVFSDMEIPKVSKQPLSHLKTSVDVDQIFLQELETLKVITSKVNSGVISPDNIVDFYYLRFKSLHGVSDYHGATSPQTKEAKKLLVEALQKLSKAFEKAYDGSVLVTAVVSDVAHTRRVRAAENETPTSATQDAETGDDEYDADYPAIFNIILWFGVVFAFTLIAIVYAIMDMDPGRDSIIYRMTSTRMKKDN